MAREIESIETEFEGIQYRSRTEARWAVFFSHLGLKFDYEKQLVTLPFRKKYLPDFFIHDFNVFFEVKPDNEVVITDECYKARALAKISPENDVWLAIGEPSADVPNILPLNNWGEDVTIQEILSTTENRYRLLEDRRDSCIYWLQSESVHGVFHKSYMVGGPGVSTDHERLPELHKTVLEGYKKARSIKF